ncbi:MAG: hypothetical protein ACLR23_18980 [Clostridia bacterium]
MEPDILRSIEKLSDEDATLYAFRVGEQQAAAIGCFAVEDLTDGIPKLIQEISSALNCDVTVQKGMVVDALEKCRLPITRLNASRIQNRRNRLGRPAEASGEWIPAAFLPCCSTIFGLATAKQGLLTCNCCSLTYRPVTQA